MSTTIYELRVDPEKFEVLEPVNESDLDLFIDGFDTQKMLDGWSAPRVRLGSDGSAGDRLLADFPSLVGSIPVFGERAFAALGEILEPHGEFLPLQSEDGSYWAFNVMTVMDLMDEDASDVERLGRDRLVTVRHLTVKPSAPPHIPPIFKLPQWRRGRSLITRELLDMALAHGLTGLDPRAIGEA